MDIDLDIKKFILGDRNRYVILTDVDIVRLSRCIGNSNKKRPAECAGRGVCGVEQGLMRHRGPRAHNGRIDRLKFQPSWVGVGLWGLGIELSDEIVHFY